MREAPDDYPALAKTNGISELSAMPRIPVIENTPEYGDVSTIGAETYLMACAWFRLPASFPVKEKHINLTKGE